MLFYVYAGYPLLVFLLAYLRPKKVDKRDILPTVTVLITAFNEERSIAGKIENTLKLDYPAEKLEILVASDGSTDRTDEIVKSFSAKQVRLFRQNGRVGKTTTQNNAVETAAGEIILFSDATTHYSPDVLRRLLPAFADESVGCVAGRLIYTDPTETNVGTGARSYWNYETLLKSAESSVCSLIGASGCLYAVRKAAYEPMYAAACSDFLICTQLYRKGLRSVFEPEATCFEVTNDQAAAEMRMRVRVIAQTFTDLWRNRDMLNPFRSGFYAIELISHKLLRYCVPLLLLAAFFTNGVLAFSSVFFAVTFALQAAFYTAAFFGWLLELKGKRTTLFVLPLYFVLANIASVVAFFQFLRGERYAAWEPIREAR
ncbi:MAG: glycosyl transferase family protein [Acidobacteria bacterium OLB17]|nr:MAG: glycosyl transferase family protein [Acidobacteria bacterium OLB17]